MQNQTDFVYFRVFMRLVRNMRCFPDICNENKVLFVTKQGVIDKLLIKWSKVEIFPVEPR